MVKALITQREVVNQYDGFSDSLEKEYVEYFSGLGIAVFPVSNFCNIDEVLRMEWDLIILTGGGILPENDYNYPREGTRQNHRDNLETTLIKHAVDNRIPLLGICRGMQKINAFFGEKISSFENCEVLREIKKSHPVKTNQGELFSVNNYHNDGLFETDVAKELEILAIDPDNNTVEAFGGRKILGIQWHPERAGNDKAAEEWIVKRIRKLSQ